MMENTSPVVISAASGLAGTAICAELARRGVPIRRLVRRAADATRGEAAWDPARGTLDPAALAGAQAVIHLSGEPIAAGRWTTEQKRRIRDSRVASTRLLAERLAGLPSAPPTLVCASAIGFYGARDDETLDEGSAPGTGFLADVCRDWEGAADPARDAGIRVVHLRIGMVLAREGGALVKMLTPFRLGLGGPLGNGRAWMSWIHLDDLVRAACFAIEDGTLSGPVNAVAPAPVTNADFTRALARALHRPALLPAPAFAIRALLGEMGQELLLASTRVLPRRLEAAGFRFAYPSIDKAFEAIFLKQH